MSETFRPAWAKPLDESFYSPDEEEKSFMKTTTGIYDDEELKQHIISAQTKAFAMYKYPCIRGFTFMSLKLARLPAYPQLMLLGKERAGAIFLDVGCFFGCDIRKVILDGWPVQNIIGVDLSSKLWNLGHELFRTTPESFPVRFLEGDILDPSLLSVVPPLPDDPNCALDAKASEVALTAASTLSELHGRVSAIFTGSFFHLFNFEQQEHVARLLSGLLLPQPGSMILGWHRGLPEKGPWCPADGTRMCCHSPESWRKLWERIFGETGVDVKVTAQLVRAMGGDSLFGTYPGNTDRIEFMDWSVTRV